MGIKDKGAPRSTPDVLRGEQLSLTVASAETLLTVVDRGLSAMESQARPHFAPVAAETLAQAAAEQERETLQTTLGPVPQSQEVANAGTQSGGPLDVEAIRRQVEGSYA